MKEEDKLKHICGTETGFRVPDGYFDHVFAKIDANLPEHPALKKRAPLSRWQRIKPYVYLAAMFGGIWCTMKMVSMMSQTTPEKVSLDNPPELVAQAMSSPEVLAQAYSSPTVMIVEESTDSFDDVENTESATPSNEQAEDEAIEMPSDYSNFVSVSDIDLNQLQAALYADETEDYYYPYYI